jgi:hypothetical protein
MDILSKKRFYASAGHPHPPSGNNQRTDRNAAAPGRMSADVIGYEGGNVVEVDIDSRKRSILSGRGWNDKLQLGANGVDVLE